MPSAGWMVSLVRGERVMTKDQCFSCAHGCFEERESTTIDGAGSLSLSMPKNPYHPPKTIERISSRTSVICEVTMLRTIPVLLFENSVE